MSIVILIVIILIAWHKFLSRCEKEIRSINAKRAWETKKANKPTKTIVWVSELMKGGDKQ